MNAKPQSRPGGGRSTRSTSRACRWRSACSRPRSTARREVGERRPSATSSTGTRSTRADTSPRGSSPICSPKWFEPRSDEPHDYPEPSGLKLNRWAPSGLWSLVEHAVVLDEAPGRIAIRLHARDVNLVMGPAERGPSVPFRVLSDGEPPGAAHGTEVDEGGNGTVSEQRLYQLVR